MGDEPKSKSGLANRTTSLVVEGLGSRSRSRPLATYFTTVVAGPYHSVHAEHDGIPIYNVSVVDEEYRLVHEPTMIDFP